MKIKFQGKEIIVPDDATEQEITQILNETEEPTIAQRLYEDIKETGGNLVSGLGRGSAGAVNSMMGLAEKSDTLRGGMESMGLPSKEVREDALAQYDAQDKGFVHGLGRVIGEIGAVGGAPSAVGRGLNLLGHTVKRFSPKSNPSVQRKLGEKVSDLGESVRTMGMRSGKSGELTKISGGAIGGATMGRLLDEDGTGIGAVMGAVNPYPTRAAEAVGRLLRDKTQPLYKSGQEDIVGNLLNESATGDVNKIIGRLEQSQPLVKGSFPTTGQVADDIGISGLEQSIVNKGIDDANQLLKRHKTSSEAREKALKDIIPNKEGAIEARKEATEELYEKAKGTAVKTTSELKKLFERPSMQEAIKRAKELSKEKSDIFDLNNLTGKELQYIKKGLDDLLDEKRKVGLGNFTEGAIRDTRKSYLKEIEKQLPDYLEANKRYSDLSRPVEQSEILSEILLKSKGTGERITPDKFIRQSTDALNKKRKQLADVLTPEQMNTVRAVEQDLKMYRRNIQDPKGYGSPTAKLLNYDALLGDVGVSQKRYGNPISAMLGSIAGKVGGVFTEGKTNQMRQLLVDALLHPQKAAKIMQTAKTNPKSAMLAYLLEATNLKASQAVISDEKGHTRKTLEGIRNTVSSGYDEWRENYIRGR